MTIFLALNTLLTFLLGVIWERTHLADLTMKMALIAISIASIIFLLIELNFVVRIQ